MTIWQVQPAGGSAAGGEFQDVGLVAHGAAHAGEPPFVDEAVAGGTGAAAAALGADAAHAVVDRTVHDRTADGIRVGFAQAVRVDEDDRRHVGLEPKERRTVSGSRENRHQTGGPEQLQSHVDNVVIHGLGCSNSRVEGDWVMVAILTRQTAAPLKAGSIAVLAATVLAACGGGNTDSAEGGNQPTEVLTPKGWELVWSDEFNGSSLDGAKWNIQTGDGTAEGIPGWGNNELQSYQAANISVGGGSLTITARQEAADGREYTSARINTANKLDVRYGRIEASIHAPGGQGLWSAFWMLPTDSEYGTWAAGGEIDIMEVFSRNPRPFNQAALHYGMAWPLNTFTYAKYEGVDPADGFHVYAVEWTNRRFAGSWTAPTTTPCATRPTGTTTRTRKPTLMCPDPTRPRSTGSSTCS